MKINETSSTASNNLEHNFTLDESEIDFNEEDMEIYRTFDTIKLDFKDSNTQKEVLFSVMSFNLSEDLIIEKKFDRESFTNKLVYQNTIEFLIKIRKLLCDNNSDIEKYLINRGVIKSICDLIVDSKRFTIIYEATWIVLLVTENINSLFYMYNENCLQSVLAKMMNINLYKHLPLLDHTLYIIANISANENNIVIFKGIVNEYMFLTYISKVLIDISFGKIQSTQISENAYLALTNVLRQTTVFLREENFQFINQSSDLLKSVLSSMLSLINNKKEKLREEGMLRQLENLLYVGQLIFRLNKKYSIELNSEELINVIHILERILQREIPYFTSRESITLYVLKWVKFVSTYFQEKRIETCDENLVTNLLDFVQNQSNFFFYCLDCSVKYKLECLEVLSVLLNVSRISQVLLDKKIDKMLVTCLRSQKMTLKGKALAFDMLAIIIPTLDILRVTELLELGLLEGYDDFMSFSGEKENNVYCLLKVLDYIKTLYKSQNEMSQFKIGYFLELLYKTRLSFAIEDYELSNNPRVSELAKSFSIQVTEMLNSLYD